MITTGSRRFSLVIFFVALSLTLPGPAGGSHLAAVHPWQQTYLKASNSGENDLFGFSVAIDGSTAVVGARFEDSAAAVVNGDQQDNSAEDTGKD